MRYIYGMIGGILLTVVLFAAVGFGLGLIQFRPIADAEHNRQLEQIRNQANAEITAARKPPNPVAQAWVDAMASGDGDAMWSLMDPNLQQRNSHDAFVANARRGEGANNIQLKPIYIGRYDSRAGASVNFFILEAYSNGAIQRSIPYTLRVLNDKIISVE